MPSRIASFSGHDQSIARLFRRLPLRSLPLRSRPLRGRGLTVAWSLAIMAAGLGFTSLAWAAVPIYSSFQLQARSNIIDGFNLAAGSSFNSGTPTLNDAGEVAFRLILDGATGNSALWFGSNGTGASVHQATDDFLISDPSIDNLGRVSFEEFDFAATHGVFVYDPVAGSATVAVPAGGLGFVGFSDPQINDAGVIGFRGDLGAGFSWSADDAGAQTHYAVEGSDGVAYLFSPRFDQSGRLAGKVRLGGLGGDQPDEIRRYESDGTFVALAVDDDSDPGSPFTGFDNGIGVSPDGRAAFVANTATARGVYLANGSTIVTIATTDDAEISAIDFFGPAVNEQGWVAFRAFDAAGLRAIFVGDGVELRRVVGEHDLVPTDLGEGRIDQNDSSPVFGGSVDINAAGDVAFHATLTPPDDNQIEWGSGIFIAYADPVVEVPMAEELANADTRGTQRLVSVQAYPNPFRSHARIAFRLAASTEIAVDIFDARGRLVRHLGRTRHAPGWSVLEWNARTTDGRPVSQGTYWARVRSYIDGEPQEEQSATLVRLR